MTTTTDVLHETVDKLARQRDQLRLQMHLASAEAQDEWQRAEAKWKSVQAKLAEAKKATGDQVEKIRKAVDEVMGELATTYQKIEAAFKNKK